MLDGHGAEHDEHVVDQGHHGRHAEGHALEPHPQVDDDADPACHQGVDGLDPRVAGHRPADGVRGGEDRVVGHVLLERVEQGLRLRRRQQDLQVPLRCTWHYRLPRSPVRDTWKATDSGVSLFASIAEVINCLTASWFSGTLNVKCDCEPPAYGSGPAAGFSAAPPWAFPRLPTGSGFRGAASAAAPRPVARGRFFGGLLAAGFAAGLSAGFGGGPASPARRPGPGRANSRPPSPAVVLGQIVARLALLRRFRRLRRRRLPRPAPDSPASISVGSVKVTALRASLSPNTSDSTFCTFSMFDFGGVDFEAQPRRFVLDAHVADGQVGQAIAQLVCAPSPCPAACRTAPAPKCRR